MSEQKKLLKAEMIAIEGLQTEHAKRLEGLRAIEAELKTVQAETAERLGLSVETFLTARFDSNGVLTFPPKLAAVSDIGQQAIESVAEQVIKESAESKEPAEQESMSAAASE